MPSHVSMIWTVFKRNFFAYFINPTGYVFITVFILLGAIAAFWQGTFFMSNLANLDQLNAYFPILLLFFVPALTMNVWAEERKLGTDELLFTLPAHNADIVAGKYLAVLGIYSVAVFFSLSHVIILAWLGDPDFGLMAATYIGYWLTGAAMLTFGMVASLLTSNATVAFVLGSILCGIFVFAGNTQIILGEGGSELVRSLSIPARFRSFGNGVISIGDVFYFIALAAIMLYINVALVGRRHLGGGEGSVLHGLMVSVRTVCVAIMAASLCVILGRSGLYIDATAERLHTLQPQTIEIIDEIPEDRPVFIQAFLSREVPEQLVQTRKNLVNLLKRLDTVGGERVRLAIHDTEPYSTVATEASDNYNIRARSVFSVAGSQRSAVDVFLGLVFTSGPEEFVVPFFDVGLPVEYELARSVRVVSQTDRKSIGIVGTDAQMFGGFDFQTMNTAPDWSFVNELRKQYVVRQVAPSGPYPKSLDALVVVLPSSLTQPQMDVLEKALLAGTPTLMFADPLPMFNPQLSPPLAKDAGRNPFTSQGQPPAPPKGNFKKLLGSIGLAWPDSAIVWCDANPHPFLSDLDPEIVFVAPGPDSAEPFNPDSVISSGLQEVVLLYASFLAQGPPVEGASLTLTPLLVTSTLSGNSVWDQIVRKGFFGPQITPNPRRYKSPDNYTLAMHITGTVPSPGGGDETSEVNAVVVSDADIVSETFFALRRQGFDINFDNVTFALNCIDVLTGDESFVALRKHRPLHRTLTRVEHENQEYLDREQEETEAAERRATDQLFRAQASLNTKVQTLRQRADLDEQTKTIMLRKLENVENRRLEVVKTSIEQEKDRQIAEAKTEMNTAISRIQRNIKWWAALLPPIPTLLLALLLFAYRYNREKIGVSERQLVGAKP